MTKPQIWVTIVLVLFIGLFVLARLTKEEEVHSDSSMMGNMPVTEEPLGELSGAQLLSNFGCLNCHGSQLEGASMGPKLTGLAEFWNRDRLINYLRNPGSFMDSDRFKEYKKKYPNMIMPAYGNKDVKDLGKIVDYLLEL
jgi:hypothetical protein